MATPAAHVQNLGDVTTSDVGATSTVLSPVSKTVTAGNTLILGVSFYYDITATSVTDNLGNTYSRSERVVITAVTSDLWYAPITTGGSITTITVNHPSTRYVDVIAAEFSGVGTFSGVGGGTGSQASGGVATWATSKTIPAYGLAVGFTGDNGTADTEGAGSASGSPSTTIVESTDGSTQIYGGLWYAIAGASDVTTFTGTATVVGASIWRSGSGGIFNPAAGGGGITEAAVGVKTVAEGANKTRTSGDTLGTLSEATTRAFVGTRSVAGTTIGTLSEAATRIAARTRTVAGESIGTLSEAATRAFVGTRSVAGSTLGTLSEAASRAFVGTRAAGDTVGTLSEAAARLKGMPRTAGDTVGSLSEAATRIAARARIAGDSIGTLSEAATRIAARARTAAETVGTLSEATARAFVGSRAVGDALATLSEVADGVKSGAHAWVQTAGDTIGTLSESVARARADWTRAAGDSVGTLGEVVTRLAARARAAGDTVGTLSETAVRAVIARVRIAGDTLGTLSEAAVGVKSMVGAYVRTAADSIAFITEAATLPFIGGLPPRAVAAVAGLVRAIATHLRPSGSAETPTPGGDATHPKPRR